MTTDAWDPGQYGRFGQERTQPVLDLLALVRPRRGMRVLDPGCGTGELTRRLHDTHTLGVDRSAAKLAGDGRGVDVVAEGREAALSGERPKRWRGARLTTARRRCPAPTRAFPLATVGPRP